ncbi:MAG: clostripain-related cysteine peptidase [Elusimicrobiaceae bacterium]|nr:clostripain-related cysteine peptidase [Elusimicrobiaceae bacterium]
MRVIISLLLIFSAGFASAAGGRAVQADPVRDWTIMLYMSGKRGVPGGAWDDAAELAKTGTTGNVAVVAEVGCGGFEDGFTGTKRFVITKGMDILAAEPQERLDNVDQGDWKNLVKFVRWAKERAPAKRYMFVFWAHGAGFFDEKKSQDISDRGVGFDLTTGNYLTLPQLRFFAREAQVDVIAFNSCLMGMAEVMHELGSDVKYVVASEETVPGDGYDYASFLAALADKPSSTAEQAALLLASTYMKSYAGEEVQIGVIRPAASLQLAKMLSVWQQNARKLDDVQAFKYANEYVLRFASVLTGQRDTSIFGDLGEFLKLFNSRLDMARPGAQLVKEQGDEIVGYIAKKMAVSYGSGKYAGATGVSVHLPALSPKITYELMSNPAFLEVMYPNLPFAQDAKWCDFLPWAYAARTR